MPRQKKKSWLKRIGITLVVLFLLYVIIGFFGVPLYLRHGLMAGLNKELAGTMEVEAFRFNPFTWVLQIEGCQGRTPDGEVALSFREFRVDVEPTSVFGDAFVVREVLLDEPNLNLIVDEEGKINIQSSLMKIQEQVEEIQAEQEAQLAESNEPFVIPAIRIDSFQVVNAGFRCEINSMREPFVREVKDLSFVMEGVSTDAAHDNPYAFEFVTARGEKVDLTGAVKLDPLSSVGTFEMNNLELPDFLLFAGDSVGFKVGGGHMDFSIDYHFVPLGANPELALRNGKLALREFSLVGEGESEPFQSIESMEMTGLGLDLLNDAVSLESFRIENSTLHVVRDKEGVLNLIRYLAPPEKQAAAAAQAKKERAAEAIEREIRLGVISDDQDLGVALTSAWSQIQDLVAVEWNLSATKVEVINQSLTWRDEFLARPADLSWTQIHLTAENLSNGEQPFPYDLQMRMNETGSIGLKGDFTPTPAASAFSFNVAELPLPAIAPYIDNLAPIRLNGGLLAATGKGEIAFPDEGLPKLSASLDSTLDGFKLDWAESDEPFLAWENVTVSGATMDTDPMALTTDSIKVTAPQIWAERDSEGNLRLPLPEEKQGSDSTPQPTPETQPTSSANGEAISITVTQFNVERGVVRVQDKAVQPATAFTVSDIQLAAGPLSFPEPEPLSVDLGFKLADGPSGVVKIVGSAEPLKPLEATEISIQTDGVTLPAFAAYAVPIIGRPPTEGHVTAKLGYSLTSGQLDGKNDIKIKNMTFGPRDKASKAPNLPLELGVAILEDSQGVMNIDIPIQGDVNDPKFSLSSTIQYAIGNVLEKLVTAPFNALGSILPGGAGEPAKFVAFEPGQAVVPEDIKSGLSALAIGLSDRPLLRLELTPSIAPEDDANALRAAKFDTQIAGQVAQGMDEEEAIEALYEALPPDLQRPEVEGQPDLTLEDQRNAIRASIPVTPTELATLAEQRAEATRQAILADGKLTPDRLALKPATPDGPAYAEDGAKVDFGFGVMPSGG
ncbi:MAG: DUF748 domain-containing protein [Puniceicoccales bacterium]